METLYDILLKHKGSVSRFDVQYNPDRSTWEHLYIVFRNPDVDITEGSGWLHIDGHSFPSYLEQRYQPAETDSFIFYSFDYGGVQINVEVRKAEVIGDLVIERPPGGAILLRRSTGITHFVLSEEELRYVKVD